MAAVGSGDKKVLNLDLSDQSSDDNEDEYTSEGHMSDREEDTPSLTSKKRKRDVFSNPSGLEAKESSSDNWEVSMMKFMAEEERRTAVRIKMDAERRAQFTMLTEKFPPSKRRKLK